METISVSIEFIAKTYEMGKNNSGATPPYAPMRISTPTPLGAFQDPLSKSRNPKKKNKTLENLYSNQLFELQR